MKRRRPAAAGPSGTEAIPMFGIDDPQIVLAYAVAIISTIACIVYGWLKRNEAD